MLRRLLGKPPRHAHGRRSDGTYFTIWFCAHGHGHVMDHEKHPDACIACLWTFQDHAPWRRATKTEAWSFVHGATGVHAMRGTAFEVFT
jgi:hypothetical protein